LREPREGVRTHHKQHQHSNRFHTLAFLG
jgi:hypothetical protein